MHDVAHSEFQAAAIHGQGHGRFQSVIFDLKIIRDASQTVSKKQSYKEEDDSMSGEDHETSGARGLRNAPTCLVLDARLLGLSELISSTKWYTMVYSQQPRTKRAQRNNLE